MTLLYTYMWVSVGVCRCTRMYMYAEVTGAVTIPGLCTAAENPSSCPFTTQHALGKLSHVPTPFHMFVFFIFKMRVILEVKNVENILRRRNREPDSSLCFCFFYMLSPSVHQTFWAAITPSVLTILTNSVIVDSYPNPNCCAHVFQGSHVSLAFPL